MFIILCYCKFTNNNNNNILALRAREQAKPALFLTRCSLETQISTTSQPAQQRQRQSCKGKNRGRAASPFHSLLLVSAAHSLWHVFCGFCPAAAVSLLGQHQQLDSSGFQQSSSCLGRQMNWTNECEMRRRRFVQLGHCLCPPLWRLPSPRVAVAWVCVLLLSVNLLLPPPLLHFICPCSLFVYSFAYCCCC